LDRELQTLLNKIALQNHVPAKLLGIVGWYAHLSSDPCEVGNAAEPFHNLKNFFFS